MRERLRWVPVAVVGLAFVSALAGLFLIVQGPEEPQWGGIKLSDWLRSGAYGDQRTALEAMSPQAFPYMLAMMQARDVRWKFQLASLLAKQNFVKIRLAPRASFRGRFEAAKGFALLGPKAAPAVPGLKRLLGDPVAAGPATYALLHIWTDEAWNALDRALADKDSAVRQAVATEISHPDGDVSRLLPAILRGLQDTNAWVREHCVQALGTMQTQPALVVHALIERLHDGSSDVSRAAADVLMSFRDNARPAVPALLEIVRQNDPTRCAAALRALRQIDPARAKLSGPD